MSEMFVTSLRNRIRAMNVLWDRLFELVRPWLAAKVSGQPGYRLVIINADELMAPLIHP